jgi:fucokinase
VSGSSRITPGVEPAFHDVVITAANASQAVGYNAEIAARREQERLPLDTRFHVIADPGGRRVGSGAATLVVIEKLAKLYRTTPALLAERRRVLILHSGGDSRRLPAYAAHGKLFLPLPRCDEQGRGIALFDLLLQDLSTLNLGERGRIVVAAGDVYLSLASQPLELTGADAVGIALRGAPAAGAKHGVYIAGRDGRVAGFLQKPTAEKATLAGALGRDGRLLLDSGVVSLSSRAVRSLVKAANAGASQSLLSAALDGRGGPVDFYEHLLIGLFSHGSPLAYADALAARDDASHERLRKFKAGLLKLSGRVVTAEKSRFVHVGTTLELLERLGPGFAPSSAPSKTLVFNSVVPRRLASRGLIVVEGSVLNEAGTFGGENVVVGVPKLFNTRLGLPNGIGIVFLPVGRNDWAVLLFGHRDDFKSRLAHGAGSNGTFLNKPVTSPALAGHTLWDAPIWRIGPLREAFAHSRRLLRQPSNPTLIPGLRSAQEIMASVNHRRLHATRLEAERLSRLQTIRSRLSEHEWLPASSIADDVQAKPEAVATIKQVELLSAPGSPHALASRALYAKAKILQRHGSSKAAHAATEEAFARVREAVDHAVRPVVFPSRPAILHDQVVWATCPARLDIAGGWTDTPPICTELGGSVVNAAVTLNGQFPLQAICRLTDEPTIRLSSIDLGRSVTYRTTAELLRVGDPTDWAALAKAALLLTGFVPHHPGATLKRHLERFGAGLDVTLFSALPKGSGLGSSSILGATLIAALLRVLDDRQPPVQRIVELASQLEQLMSTGGGWQDQAGGTIPGVKLLTTAPGPGQTLSVRTVPQGGSLGTAEAASRCLLYYTGQRRLAKNILRNVVGSYLGREPHVRNVIEHLKAGAAAMDASLREAGSLDEVGAHLADYWSLKKRLDPGATNENIESLFSSIDRHLSGGAILGAGGGGFALLIAKDERAAASIKRRLMATRASPLARFYDFMIDQQGLNVSVL